MAAIAGLLLLMMVSVVIATMRVSTSSDEEIRCVSDAFVNFPPATRWTPGSTGLFNLRLPTSTAMMIRHQDTINGLMLVPETKMSRVFSLIGNCRAANISQVINKLLKHELECKVKIPHQVSSGSYRLIWHLNKECIISPSFKLSESDWDVLTQAINHLVDELKKPRMFVTYNRRLLPPTFLTEEQELRLVLRETKRSPNYEKLFISPDARKTVIRLMCLMKNARKLPMEVLLTGARYFDLYIATQTESIELFTAIAVACLTLAFKYHFNQGITYRQFSLPTIDKMIIIRTESTILNTLQFNLNVATPLTFYHLIENLKLSYDIHGDNFLNLFLEASLFDVEILRERPSKIMAASLWISAVIATGNAPLDFEKATGNTVSDIVPLLESFSKIVFKNKEHLKDVYPNSLPHALKFFRFKQSE